MRANSFVAIGATAVLTASALSACSSSSPPNAKSGKTTGSSISSANLVTGGKITVAEAGDPSSLDPQKSLDSGTTRYHVMAYDSLVVLSPKGEIVSELAKSWSQHGNGYTFDIKKGVTCADGSAMDAKVVGENLSYTANPKNKSPMTGFALPASSKISVDAGANSVTVTPPQHDPFFLQHLTNLFMICQKGLDNRGQLATKTFGTGPYILGSAQPKSHYTYTLRKGYTWGPGGATTAQEGMPATVTFQIVPNESTVANLLLNGQANIGDVFGPDRKRLEAAGLFHDDAQVPQGEFLFNQKAGSIVADTKVRQALMMAIDFPQLRKVFSQGYGVEPKGMFTPPYDPCHDDGVVSSYPKHDVAAAKQLLAADGWASGPGGVRVKNGQKLSLVLAYDAGISPEAPASELAITQLKALGVEVKGVAMDVINDALFGTKNWDMAWQGIGPADPAGLVPFFSGPTPPKGNNFGNTNNAKYNALVKQAQAADVPAGCALWNQAEASLLANADVRPFTLQTDPTWGAGVQFNSVNQPYFPTSLRQTKK